MKVYAGRNAKEIAFLPVCFYHKSAGILPAGCRVLLWRQIPIYSFERRKMDYVTFRSAVCSLLSERKEWELEKDWEEELPTGNGTEGLEEFIVLQQEKGAFYELVTIGVKQLYKTYTEEGWDAVLNALDKYTRHEKRGTRRTRAVNYEERLNEEGVLLYRELKSLRASMAAQRGLPPYFLFMNRSLYEMCCRQPSDMRELLALYGVGEKNADLYGEEFLGAIQKFNGGEKKSLEKLPL